MHSYIIGVDAQCYLVVVALHLQYFQMFPLVILPFVLGSEAVTGRRLSKPGADVCFTSRLPSCRVY